MVQVGVIGCGAWGSELVRTFHECVRSNVTAVCDTDIGRLNVIRGRFPGVETHTDWQELIARDDVTLVIVATPLDSHYTIAREAIRLGKHVLVETPFTRKAEQAEELVDLARHQGVLLAVDFTSLLTPEIQKIREMIGRGELGDLNFVDVMRTSLGSIERQADVMLDLASHELAMIEFLTARTPNSVLATGSCHTNGDQVDVAYINLDYGEGLMANLHVNRLVPVHARRLMIGGTHKTVILDDTFTDEKLRVYQGTTNDIARDGNGIACWQVNSTNRLGDVVIPKLPTRDALAEVVRHLVSAITDGAPLVIDGRMGRNVMRILESCHRSLYEDTGQLLKESSAPAALAGQLAGVLITASKDATAVSPAPPVGMSVDARDSLSTCS